MSFVDPSTYIAANHQRIGWIDAAKGISILMVVVHHTNIVAHDYEVNFLLYDFISKAFKPVRMPLFFAVSGFLAASMVHRSWRILLEKKFFFYLYLFIVWSAIQILFFKYVAPHPSANFSRPLIENIITGLYRPTTGIWFIWALPFYFVFVRIFAKSPYIAISFSLAISIAASSPIVDPLDLNFAQKNALKYISFFVIPALVGFSILEKLSKSAFPSLMVLIGTIFVFAVSKYLSQFFVIAVGVSAVSLGVCGMICGIILAAFISKINPAKKVFVHLGKNTLSIYLIHLMVISLTALVLNNVLPSSVDQYVFVPLMAGMGIGGSLLIARYLKHRGGYWLFSLPNHSVSPSSAGAPNLRL